jgi:hypothetical protein
MEAPAAAQISIHGEPEPKAQSEAAPAELPAAPPVPLMEIAPPDATVQQVIGESVPSAAPPQPPKKPGLLRRAFGRIAHTFGNPKKD